MRNNTRKNLNNLLNQEIQALKNLHRSINSDFDKAVSLISRVRGKLVVSGLGKSGYIGMKIAATMTSLGTPSVFLNANEALHGDLGLVAADDTLLAVSFSGQTKELIKVVRHLKKHGVAVISITGNRNSLLAKAADVSLIINIKEEGSPFNLAPMASTTATLVLGDLLAAALSAKRGFKKKDFVDFHSGGTLGLKLVAVEDLMIRGSGIPKIKENSEFREALQEMTAKRLGITAVVDNGGKLVGAITDGDIRRFLLSGRYSESSKVEEAMTLKPKYIDSYSSLQEALSLMEANKITSLFVVDKGKKTKGIIHMHQIIEDKLI